MMTYEQRNRVLELASEIGGIASSSYPSPTSSPQSMPKEHIDAISELVIDVVCRIEQAWLNAGSERDVTIDNLGPHIEEHMKGWVDPDAK